MYNAAHHLESTSSDNLRTSIKSELVGKIDYDQADVFRRLCLQEVDSNLVDECVKFIQTTRNEDIETLKDLIATHAKKIVRKRPAKKMESSETESDEEEDEKKEPTRKEKRMKDLLIRILQSITNFNFSPSHEATETSRPRRGFRSPTRKPRCPEGDFSSVIPDIELISYSALDGSPCQWRDRDMFGEFEASSDDGPKGHKPHVVPRIVLQCVDYARFLMSCRPFMLFCYGLLVFGTKFCVGIFDRQGVVLSPFHDMFEDLHIFVRVVRRATHSMSIHDLGFDRTVRPLSDEETIRLTGHQQKSPSSIITVSPVGLPPTQWCTIGKPRITPIALVGRGNTVWTVKEYYFLEKKKSQTVWEALRKDKSQTSTDGKWVLKNEEMILKTGWRSNLRSSETEIFHHVHRRIPDMPGLAKLECGGDVLFPDPDVVSAFHKPISVHNLRKYPQCNDLSCQDKETLILHRIVLKTAGYPMWEYKTDLQLMRVFRDALLAHKRLYEAGILHCDISPSSVLIAETPKGSKAVIFDIASAEFDSDMINAPIVTKTKVEGGRLVKPTCREHIRFEGSVSMKPRGGQTTKTAQFMGQELVCKFGFEEVKHQVHHDIESLIWNLLYSLMRNIIHKSESDARPEIAVQRKNLIHMYQTAFGQTTIADIAFHRHTESTAATFVRKEATKVIVDAFVSKPLQLLIYGSFRELIFHSLFSFIKCVPFTYDAVLQPTDETIKELGRLNQMDSQ